MNQQPSAGMPLPNWPALMDLSLACAYTDLKEATFQALANRYSVRPVETGFRLLRWKRADLDRLIDKLPYREPTLGPDSPPSTEVVALDPAREALEAASRRMRRKS